ncbi:polyketide synthase [Penicillium paradoxum]|uniref:polyketide synthase n=1 Tax=Penicillium paradoxum TaxID=176176 RepID=UPI0025493B2D|nr:polyketide synthase [Penicillium paradoxum]KAJ5794563.1 polyketide synthase [Penicillium paradoxum]
MASPCQLLVFGDLNYDFVPGLGVLCGLDDNALLTSFIERTAFALRAQISSLPLAKRAAFPKFTTLRELLAKVRTTNVVHPALQKALILVVQFGSFIRRFTQPGRVYPTNADTRLTGLCTGLLTAVTISCCSSLSDLIPSAVDSVVLAFRAGLLVEEVRVRIEPSVSKAGSWSVVIPGLKEDVALEALEKYILDKVLSDNMPSQSKGDLKSADKIEFQGIPVASSPYVSAYARSGVTLSGPSSVLDDILSSGYLTRSSGLKTQIYTPFHAPHLYDESNVEEILQTISSDRTESQFCRIAVQTSRGQTSPGSDSPVTLASLLRVALEEILLQPLRLDTISEGVAEEMVNRGTGTCTIVPVATPTAQTFLNVMKMAGIEDATIDGLMNGLNIPEISMVSESGHMGNSKLAIVGYSGRYPDANNNEAFWQLLEEARDVASITPKQRWDVNTHVDPTLKKKNTSGTPYGCWLTDPGLFDAKFFGMSPREAPQVDPAQRLSLMTAYEAMENAGMVPDATPSTQRDRVGVFVGTTSNDWGETNSSQDVDTYYIPGSCRAFIPGRQNYFYKFSGPSYSVDTACSSSLAAMHLACNALWRGDIDTAISGGTNVMTNPDITAGLDRGYFLSRTGNCKTFDDDADGYCRGEGVVSMVIKRLEDAIADNDPIRAVILGAYTNHSAEAESITRPHVGAQKAIFERVLTTASVDPATISYIEMHGTGTQAGDAREMDSVLSTFANQPRENPIHLGSVKANVGHGESVSGVIALTKVLMMMEKNVIPPHSGIKTKINHKFPTDLEKRNVFIADKLTPWVRSDDQPRRAMVNNFSAAGGNSSILVEDGPTRTKSKRAEDDPRSFHPVAVSAKTQKALLAGIRDLISYIDRESPSLPSLSYTTTARRTHHRYRVMVSGNSLEEISAQLQKCLVAPEDRLRPKVASSVVFAFTGQGAQYPGMARELLAIRPFRSDMEQFDRIVQKQGFPPIMPLITATTGEITDYEPLVVQLATTCSQMAMARLWRSWGIAPAAVVGHSLGEYAALNVAGVLSDVDTIFLTGKRAQLLQEKCTRDTHSMLAVSISVEDANTLLAGLEVEIACKNAPTETVLSGTSVAIDQAEKVLNDAGIKKMTRLRVPYAFHSTQVDAILDEFETVAAGVQFHKPQIPLVSPLLSHAIKTEGIINPRYLARHARDAVDFSGALQDAKLNKLITEKSVWIEIGPHPVVVGLVKANLGPVVVLPTLQRKRDAWKVLTNTTTALYESGYAIQWGEYHRDFTKFLEVLRLPNYNWDLQNYWMQYVNDWSLYKGDAAFLSGARAPPLSTTCVHRLVEEKHDSAEITVVGESDLLRDDLDPFVRGHRVNGVALCTPSVYAEMALVLGDYIRISTPKWAECLVDVQHMDVQRPLAVKSKGKGPQLLRCRVTLDVATEKAAVQFYSVTPEGKTLVKHAECSITFPSAAEAEAETQAAAGEILKHMIALRRSIEDNDRVQKMAGSTGYQLVSSLASYDPDYKGVTEVVMDSENLEAVAKVKCSNTSVTDTKAAGIYKVNPYLIDNFGQPALFIMNANDGADLEKEVFVNHGWTSLHFYKEVSVEKVYHSYVKMTGPKEDGMYSGDMTVFEGDEVVACFRGIKAQGVPRRLMDYIVRMRDDTQVGLPGATNTLRPANGTAETRAAETAVESQDFLVEDTTSLSSWPAALKIVSEESGVPVDDLTDDKAFADLGVDSLLSLLCASRFREELGLAHESTIFEEYSTVMELRQFWEQGATSTGDSSAVTGKDAILDSMFHHDNVQESSSSPSTPSESGSSTDEGNIPTPSTSSELSVCPGNPKAKASSLLLQGNPASSNTSKTLFLLPDGSGSASSYASLPIIDPSLAVVALNCPYMKGPSSYPVGIDHVASLYIKEIQRRQPCGPYALGGWSVGGIFAYHCAQLLAAEGEVVSDLVLLDCPVPRGLDHLPKRYFEYCDKIGLLGVVHSKTGERKAPPPWLIPHFEACINSLHDYHASPFEPEHSAPTTHIIWACDSIDAHLDTKFEHRDDDPEGLKFLTVARQDYGPCGWETLLPRTNMRFARVSRANHFSMMQGELARNLSEIMKHALMG